MVVHVGSNTSTRLDLMCVLVNPGLSQKFRESLENGKERHSACRQMVLIFGIILTLPSMQNGPKLFPKLHVQLHSEEVSEHMDGS